jgi:MoxR-like ATPase
VVTADNATTPAEPVDSFEDWRIYRGGGQRHDEIDRLPPPPRWRRFSGGEPTQPGVPVDDPVAAERANGYQVTDEAIEMVNAALYTRRPLLVTGKPGTGKSTLAYSIAAELRLGPVLYWPITSRSRLEDGLYRYDAIGRLQESNLLRVTGQPIEPIDVGRYVTLGPLGTAMLPGRRPRVLLIDELDKSDIDLPNDLLNVFEEGRFEIPELVRLPAEQERVEVATADRGAPVEILRGTVRSYAFPVIVITSNGEREFPPAFLRRCLRHDMRPPDQRTLTAIVRSMLGADTADRPDTTDLIEQFLDQRDRGDVVTTDQLLNAIYVLTSGVRPPESTRTRLRGNLIRDLSAVGTT